MLILLVLIQLQSCKSVDLLKKSFCHGMAMILCTSSYNYPLLQQSSVCEAHTSLHTCEPQAGAELPAPSAFPWKGPSGNRSPTPPAQRRQQGRARGTPAPLGTAPFDLLLPPKHQPGTHNTAAYSNHSKQRRFWITVTDKQIFLFFPLCMCFANPPSKPRPCGTDRPPPERCPPNQRGWESPPRSNPAHDRSPLRQTQHSPECRVQCFLKHLQGR